MYFPLLFQVISYGCFISHLPHPLLCILFTCMSGLVSYEYLYSPLSLEYHSCLRFHKVYSSFCFRPSIHVIPNDQKQSKGSSVPAEIGETSAGDSGGNSAAVDQVFSMFKDFLEKKLEDKGKQIEQRSKLDKEVVQLKFKGNQKQFELNAELNTIFESIETESKSIEPNLSQIKKLSQEGRQRIRKQQKLTKIADKCKDGWQVVAKYKSDELASRSEDE